MWEEVERVEAMVSVLGTSVCHVHKSAGVLCPTLTPHLSPPVCTSASLGGR